MAKGVVAQNALVANFSSRSFGLCVSSPSHRSLKAKSSCSSFSNVFVILFKVESTQHPTHQLPVDWQSLGESSLDPARDTKIIYSIHITSYNYTNTEGSKCSRILLQEPGSRLANWMQLWGFAAWNSHGSRSIIANLPLSPSMTTSWIGGLVT